MPVAPNKYIWAGMGGAPYRGPIESLFQPVVFGGERALKADKAALMRAQEMLARGMSGEEIWSATGWFQGADGKWRFEIPDTTASVSQEGLDLLRGGGQAQLGEIYNHPELFANYPELAGIKVAPETDPLSKGGFSPGTNELTFRADSPDYMSTVTHETQHAIQSQEGFAPGGNLFSRILENPLAMKIKKLFDEWRKTNETLANYRKAIMENSISKISTADALNFESRYNELSRQHPLFEEAERLERYGDELKRTIGVLQERRDQEPPTNLGEAYDFYKTIAGEVEARNVGRRYKGEGGYPPAGEDVARALQHIFKSR